MMYRANESDGTVEITVNLNNPSITDITVQIVSSDITAISESTRITLLPNLPPWHLRMYTLHIRVYITNTCVHTYIPIKTHSSELRGQEEAGLRDEPVSYLQVAPL